LFAVRARRDDGGRRRQLADARALAMRALFRPLADQGRFRPAPLRDGRRRLLLLQLDGVSHDRLRSALAADLLPSVARRLDAGQLELSSFRSGLPASTPAFQAGLFYGVAPSVPGFIWYDRATGRQVRMDRAADAARLETRLRGPRPGLLRGGSSYFGILSGDAAMPRFCLSGMAGAAHLAPDEPPLGIWDLAASTLAHSLTAVRGVARLVQQTGAGLADGVRWSAMLGRLRHEPRFLLHRAFITSVLRELAVQGILLDVSRGVPVVYADLLAYDETAHRRGPESPAALEELAGMDRAIGAVLAAVEAAPELGYDVYLLSDHGNVPTRPFEQLAGISLPEYVARAERGAPLPRRPQPIRPNRGLAGGRTLGQAASEGVVTAEAGDLAHVYFVREPGGLPLEALRARHWRVLAALEASPAVGLVAVRGGSRGFLLQKGTAFDLADPADVARLPHPEPGLLADYVAELLSLRDSGDLVVFGWRGPHRESVAYAWEFGAHGGVAPEELSCFAVHPPACALDFERVVRPSELNAFFEERYRAPLAGEEEPFREGMGEAGLP
jgi:hypothetical protein